MHIAIAGNIGSGKTTLTTLLAKHYKYQPHFEEVDDNPLKFGDNSNIISEGRVSVTGTARSSKFSYHVNGDEDPNNFDGVFDEGNESSPSNRNTKTDPD